MKSVVLEALDQLALALADHDYQWSPELRRLYEKAVREAKKLDN